MSNYGVAQSGGNQTRTFDTNGNPIYTPNPGLNIVDLPPGEKYFLFSAESPTAPQASVAISLTPAPGEIAAITFSIDFATAPTATLSIQGSNLDADASYQTLYTSTNKQHDNYTDTVAWRFYRALLSAQSAGGAITVTANRR